MEPNVIELPVAENLPTVHKLAIFLIGGIAAFGAQMLVEKGYLKGLSAYRAVNLSDLTE